MATFLDIIGSMLIGSILLLVSVRIMDSSLRDFINHNADAIVQSEMAGLTRIIQADLRKMGFGIPENKKAEIIQIAEPTRLRFLANLNMERDHYDAVHGNQHIDFVPDTIDYRLAPKDTVVFIDTLIVFYDLVRTVNVSQESDATGPIGTVVNNSIFRYLDQIGQPVQIIQSTKMVEVNLIAMNPDIFINDEVLSAAGPTERMVELRKLLGESFWRQTRVISKNLRR